MCPAAVFNSTVRCLTTASAQVDVSVSAAQHETASADAAAPHKAERIIFSHMQTTFDVFTAHQSGKLQYAQGGFRPLVSTYQTL
jgi:hypothetical protein